MSLYLTLTFWGWQNRGGGLPPPLPIVLTAMYMYAL